MTRRSTPMMRSRLRSPTSKSIAMVFFPSSAMPVAMLALVVVFPTPPLPEVTTTILDTEGLLSAENQTSRESNKRPPRRASKFFCANFFRACVATVRLERGDADRAVLDEHLGRLAAQLLGDGVGGDELAAHRNELGLEAVTEDAGVGAAMGAGERAAHEAAVDVDVAVGDDLRAGIDRREDDEIGALRVDDLAATHRRRDRQRRLLDARRGRSGRSRRGRNGGGR